MDVYHMDKKLINLKIFKAKFINNIYLLGMKMVLNFNCSILLFKIV